MNGEQQGQEHKQGQNEASIEYHFADFRISRSQQVLMQGNDKIVISTKAYYMLMIFLKNHGRILKKDDIINAVWPGQIVTDTALTKQIVRLRQLIGDDDSENPIIETHRGVGYRFAQDVELHELKKQQSTIIRKKNYKSLLILILFALLLSGVIYMTQFKNNTSESGRTNESKPSTINLAIVPADGTRQWFNSSGLDYLSNLLDKNPSINSISPRPEWYQSTTNEKLAIELTSNKNINYATVIKIKKINNEFVASVKLRNSTKILASEQFKAGKIAPLLVMVNNWITTVLAAYEKVSFIKVDELLTQDDYALESYLQGLFQKAVDANQQKANDYFQSAVNKDAEFLEAWIKLLETHVHLGHFEKAIALADNILPKFKGKLQDSHLIKIHYLIAFAEFRLRDEESAQVNLRKSIQYVNQSDNPYIKLAGLKSLNLLAYLQKDWSKAEKYALQRVALAKDYYPFDGYMAGMYLFLSEIVSYQQKFKQAKDYSYQAIEYYERTNNSNGMITALAGLNQLNYYHNNIDEGVVLTEKATPYLKTATDPDKVMFFLLNSSMILNLRGLFDRTDAYIKQIQDIATQLNNPLYQVMADLVKLHRYYVQNKFSQAQKYINTMLTTFENNPSLAIDLSHVYMFDMLVSARADDGIAALKKYNNYLKKFPDLQQKFPIDLKRILGHVYVKYDKLSEGIKLLEESELENRKDFNTHIANYIGLEILEILLQYPEIDYKPVLARVAAHTDYDYLFYKLKAQFLAREGKYFDAALLMSENKQKANQLWDADDQLLLEDYQSKIKK